MLFGCTTNEGADKSAPVIAQNSELINTLDSFNQHLFKERKIAERYYDITQIQPQLSIPVTRSAWRWVLVADGGGALKGAISGAEYGMLASPSGAVAGAVVCGILNAAAASIIAGWASGGGEYATEYPFGDKYTGEIYEAVAMYDIYSSIPQTKIDS